MLKLIAPAVKKLITLQTLENSESEPKNTFPKKISTQIKTKATTSKATPISSRNTFLNNPIQKIFIH